MIDIKTMSRKETIKALRACFSTLSCKDCPLHEPRPDGYAECMEKLGKHAADVLEASVSVQYE